MAEEFEKRFNPVPIAFQDEEPRKPRGSDALMIARRARVEKLMAMQIDAGTIQQTISDEMKVTTRTVRSDIASVWRKWDLEARDERPRYREQMRRTLKRLMQSASAVKDYKGAISAARELCKIDGLYAPLEATVAHTGTIETRVERMTSGEQRQRLEEMYKKWAPPPPVKGNGHDGTNGEDRGHNGSNGDDS